MFYLFKTRDKKHQFTVTHSGRCCSLYPHRPQESCCLVDRSFLKSVSEIKIHPTNCDRWTTKRQLHSSQQWYLSILKCAIKGEGLQSLKHNDHDQGERREWNRQIAGCPLRSLQCGAVKAWSFCWNSRIDRIDVWRQSVDTVVSSQWDFHAHPQASHLVLSCACITFLLLPDLIFFLGMFRSNNHNT